MLPTCHGAKADAAAHVARGVSLRDERLAAGDAPLDDIIGDGRVEMLLNEPSDVFPAVKECAATCETEWISV